MSLFTAFLGNRPTNKVETLLESCGISPTRGHEYCHEQGIDSVLDIVEAGEEDEFIDALDVPPDKRKRVKKELKRQEKNMGRAGNLGGPPLKMEDGKVLGMEATHGGNGTVEASKWGLTVSQFNRFIAMCRKDDAKWSELAGRTGGEGEMAGHVNCYQLRNEFVIPFTSGTQCSVSLLLNGQSPMEADVMVCHTWGDDVLELQDAINDIAESHDKGEDLVIWCCLFSVYQAASGEEGSGDEGPTVEDQLVQCQLKESVVRSPSLSCVRLIVTSVHNPFERLWCVYELLMGLDVMDGYLASNDERGSDFVKSTFSQTAWTKYRSVMRDWSTREGSPGLTEEEWNDRDNLSPAYALLPPRGLFRGENTQCGNDVVAHKIRSSVQSRKGGWEAANERMNAFFDTMKAEP